MWVGGWGAARRLLLWKLMALACRGATADMTHSCYSSNKGHAAFLLRHNPSLYEWRHGSATQCLQSTSLWVDLGFWWPSLLSLSVPSASSSSPFPSVSSSLPLRRCQYPLFSSTPFCPLYWESNKQNKNPRMSAQKHDNNNNNNKHSELQGILWAFMKNNCFVY